MTRVDFCDERLGVAFGQLQTRRKHASANQVESCARNQPSNDAAGARFAHRVRRDGDVGKLFVLHGTVMPRLVIKPREMQRTRSREGSKNLTGGFRQRKFLFFSDWGKPRQSSLRLANTAIHFPRRFTFIIWMLFR